MNKKLPAHIVIKREMQDLELKTLTNGTVMLRATYWRDSTSKGSVKFYLDAGCIGWQLVDPVARLLKERLEDAQQNIQRLKDGLP